MAGLVTQEDLLVTKGELEAAIRAVDGKIGGLRSDIDRLRGDVGAMRSDIDRLQGDVGGLRGHIRVLYWMTGTTLAGVAALLGMAITIALHIMHLE